MSRKWTILRPITVFDWLPAPLKEKIESYNQRINELLQRRKEIDDQADRIMAGELSLADFEATNDHRYGVVEALELERTLRTEVAEQLEPAMREAMHKARTAADEKHRKTFCEVYCDLLKLGYLRNHQMERGLASAAIVEADKITTEFAPDGSQVGRIQPVHVMAHPRVHAAMSEAQTRGDYANDYSWFRENHEALAQLARDFEQIKRQLVQTI